MNRNELPIFDLKKGLEIHEADSESLKCFHDACYFDIVNHKNELFTAIQQGDLKAADFYSDRILEYALYCGSPGLCSTGRKFMSAAHSRGSTVDSEEIQKLGIEYVKEMERFAEVWPHFREETRWRMLA